MRRPRRPVPLTVRITATTTLVLAAALLVVVGFTAQASRRHLATALDDRLHATAESFRQGPAGRIQHADELAREAPRWLAAQSLAGHEVVAVRTAQGAVFTSTGGLDLTRVPGAVDLLTTRRAGWWTLPTPDGAVRALTVPLDLGTVQIGTLVVAASRAPVESTLRAQLTSIGWASLLGLVLAALLAFVAVRRALRPLVRMSRAVAQVQASGDLSRRVRCPGPADEVGRLGDAFDGLLGRLDALVRAKRQFLSDASHELRTPLTVARGQLELASADLRTGAPVAGALTELDRMGRLIEDLLLLARLDEGLSLVREPVEVELVVQEALLRGLRIANRAVQVDAEPELYAWADPDRLLQVLTNLVVNAIQHAGARARLQVRVDRVDDQVRIAVSDDGDGIQAAELAHVFDRFHRAAGAGAGTGLGLAIVDSLVRAMQGQVTVCSTPGVGTTFTVLLRAAGSPVGACAAPAAGPPVMVGD